MTADLIKTIQTSMDAFDSCDWTHEYRRDGEIFDRYCEGGDDECDYCAAVHAAANEARIVAEEAISLLRSGDIVRATRLIEQAVGIERAFGDAPAYRPALLAVLALREDAE